MKLKINDTFSKELPADINKNNTRRQVYEACFSYVKPRVPTNPTLLHVSDILTKELGITATETTSKEFLNMVSGTELIAESKPYAMCYGGHQFGHWAGQLGDGRAINLAEIKVKDKQWVLQLKGAGETPYSRTADGLAVLRSSIREHLCSEAMFHLGVPTTRSLSLCLTGDEVLRDMMYDGNAAMEKGAVVCRVATSFIRFGNFQIFASRNDTVNLQKIVDYTIKHFFPAIEKHTKEGYIEFFKQVSERTLKMIVDWQRVGFVHGVMNTDNLSILGLTIDYGPYGWLEGYDTNWTPNTTDKQHRRYRYGNQPAVAHWNLYQLANTLMLLIGDSNSLEAILKNFQNEFILAKQEMMRQKLGLELAKDQDHKLISDLEKTLEITEVDMTIFYRLLADISGNDSTASAINKLRIAFYKPEELTGIVSDQWIIWIQEYLNRLKEENENDLNRKTKMNKYNPKYVLRNYMAQLAIDVANKGDYSIINELYELLKNPYDEQIKSEKWFAKRPEWARHKVGCSMLSCSS